MCANLRNLSEIAIGELFFELTKRYCQFMIRCLHPHRGSISSWCRVLGLPGREFRAIFVTTSKNHERNVVKQVAETDTNDPSI